MEPSETRPQGQKFRRRLFGYARSDVDRTIGELTEQHHVDEAARAQTLEATTGLDLGHHLAALLTRFAEAVSAGEQEASEHAAAIIANAEAEAEAIEGQARQLLQEAHELAVATFAEAGRRYEDATAAHRQASERIEDAIERMAEALAALGGIPSFPEVSLQQVALDQLARIKGGLNPPTPDTTTPDTPALGARALDDEDHDFWPGLRNGGEQPGSQTIAG